LTKSSQANTYNTPVICGVETEYGVLSSDPKVDHFLASAFVVNAFTELYKNDYVSNWNFDDETPGMDVFGNNYQISVNPDLKNLVLTNGSRFYVDHAHPEYATPECISPLDVLKADKIGDQIAIKCAEHVYESHGVNVTLYKNNSDGKGNSYGTHENYLLNRKINFENIVEVMLPHLISRQIYTGSGKVGSENGTEYCDFQISQRSDFFEQIIGVETTNRRPIINTRDEPHATFDDYRRLHVIAGDANLCEVAQYLKVGVTQLILQALTQGIVFPKYDITDPIKAVQSVSRDITCKENILGFKENISPLDVQEEFYNIIYKEVNKGNIDFVDSSDILGWWAKVLDGLRTSYKSVSKYVDWAAKLNLLESYIAKNDLDYKNPKIKAINVQYHDLRPAKSLFLKCKTEKILSDKDLNNLFEPPADTRAYFRGKIIQKYNSSVESVNWDNILVRIQDNQLVSIPMMNPHLGTKHMVEGLINSCESIDELVNQIGGKHD
jgi:proteasome accessory factor PafA2